jgi:hypothetical protein
MGAHVRLSIRRSLLVVLFGILLALVAGTNTATAEIAPSGGYGNKVCDPGELCLYEHENYGGVFTEWNCPVSNCTLKDFRYDTFHDGSAVNDRVTAVWNRLDKYATLFQEAGAEPGQCCFLTIQPAGRRGDQYSHVGSFYNDSFSSVIMAYS